MTTNSKVRLFTCFCIILFATGVTWALKAQQQQEKDIVIKLNRAELETLYGIVDDAAVPGQVRKPLLQKLATAYNTAYPQVPQMQPRDTSKTKKN